MTEALQALVFVVALAIAVFSRRWSLGALAFLLPLTKWLPDTPIPGLNATNLLLLPVLFHAVMAGPNPASKGRRDPVLAPAIILMAFIGISLVRVRLAASLPVQFVHLGGQHANLQVFKTILVGFVFYWCALRLSRYPDVLRPTIGGVMAGFLLQAFMASSAFVAGIDLESRAEGMLGEPNQLGLFISTYAMLPLAVLLNRTKKLFAIAVPAVIISVLGILATLSRGAMVAAAGATTMMALVKRSLWIVPVAAVLATSPIWLPQSVLDRFNESRAKDRSGLSSVPGFVSSEGLDITREGRIHLWRAGLRMVAAHPLLGVGMGQFPHRLHDYGYPNSRKKGPHNVYLWLAAQCGIPACLAHVALLLGLSRIAIRMALMRGNASVSTLGLGIVGMVTSFAVGGMFLSVFYSNLFSGPFWILAGIAIGVYYTSSNPTTTGNVATDS